MPAGRGRPAAGNGRLRPVPTGAQAGATSARERPAGGGRQRGAAPRSATARRAAAEDARLLLALQALLPALTLRMLFLAMGYAAIGPLAAAYAEILPLPSGARLILLPATVFAIGLGLRQPMWGRRALIGWVAGIIATGIYDILRISLVLAGLWGDPIPSIGRLMLSDPDAGAYWGYLWRFLGNGGGMGMAFAMLPWRGVRSGMLYGSLICSGLYAVLLFTPSAQEHFFPLTPVTAAGAMAGHLVYGAVLGGLTARWLPPVRRGGRHARRPAAAAAQERTSRAIAADASATFASASGLPEAMASRTQ